MFEKWLDSFGNETIGMIINIQQIIPDVWRN